MPKGIYKRLSKDISKDIIDKHSIQYLKYKDIAIECIKSGYSNIRAIYKKYYPKANEESLRTEPYRMLDNVRFQASLEEAWSEIKIDDLDICRAVIRVLHSITLNGKKEADRINAASWLGKSKGMFKDVSEVTEVNKDDNQFSLDRLSRIKLNTEPVDNKEDKQ